MPKFYRIILPILLLVVLCACTASEALPSSSAGAAEGSTVPTSPDAAETSSPLPATTAAPVDNSARGALFRAFLSENYKALSDAFFSGISGVGFIDLDLDGGIELVMFDAGASAAMGLEFFDIVDGAVECVSANMEPVGEAFGGAHLSAVSVSANRFEDFRLLKSKADGKEFFLVESGNGSLDFRYSELIRFGCDEDNVLTLTSLFYMQEDYDIDSGEIIGERFRIGKESADRAAFEAAYADFFAGLDNSGFDVRGVLMWDDPGYSSDLDGLLVMADKALSLYEIR